MARDTLTSPPPDLSITGLLGRESTRRFALLGLELLFLLIIVISIRLDPDPKVQPLRSHDPDHEGALPTSAGNHVLSSRRP